MTETQTTALLDAALAYAARGWQVFPCHTPWEGGCSCFKHTTCPDIGKHPRWSDDTQHGLQDATTDEATIRRWWTQWPSANVAIRTGAISGLVVLDRDDYKGGGDTLEELERTYSPLPETVLGLTGGGGSTTPSPIRARTSRTRSKRSGRASTSEVMEAISLLRRPCTRAARAIAGRSYWIPGSWNVRMSYTDDISVPNP